jgi:hypothetical protein
MEAGVWNFIRVVFLWGALLPGKPDGTSVHPIEEVVSLHDFVRDEALSLFTPNGSRQIEITRDWIEECYVERTSLNRN